MVAITGRIIQCMISFFREQMTKKTGNQLLSEHLNKVSELMRKACESIGLSSLGSLAGLIHDVGKAQAKWQVYLFDPNPKSLVPHAPISARWFWLRYGKKAAFYEQITAQVITLAIYAHHAGLPDVLSPDGEKLFFNSLVSSDEDSSYEYEEIGCFLEGIKGLKEIDALFCRAVGEWTDLCKRVAEGMPKEVRQDTEINYVMMLVGLAVRYLYSCLIDADRLDAACWEDGRETRLPEFDYSIWEGLASTFEANLEERSQREALRASPEIHRLRRTISMQCRDFSENPDGVYRLYAPTGSGKCYSSLRYALHHAASHKKKRILFVIPYLSVLAQNAKEIREILGNPDGLILEHHSNVIVDNSDEDSKKDDTHRLLTERWDSPIIVTTMVQLMNTLFLGRSQSARRMQALSDAVIIIDEVQALPVHCISLFNVAMTFLSAICRSTILLCTATQPALAQTPYPVQFGEPVELLRDYEEAFRAFRRTRTVNRCRRGGYTCAEVAEIAVRQCGEQGSALVVMNTKRGVKKVYKALAAMETGYKLHFLTTELCAAHRLEVIENIRNGLESRTPIPLIVVSTSLVEFGMNLSFGCAIRALAGLDSLVQVSGRVNRHGEQRRRPVILLRCSEENTGCLPELVRALQSTDNVLHDLKGREEDLISPEAIQMYYRYYFRESERVINAPVHDPVLCGQTLCDYLGANEQALHEGKVSENHLLPHQSFRTAGSRFCVIWDNTVGVIVPWGEGGHITTALAGAATIEEKKKLLRRAQLYTVSVYQNKLAALQESEAVFLLKEVGAVALRPEFYHDIFGVSLTPHFYADDNIL